MNQQISVAVEDSSQIGYARRKAVSLANECGFAESTIGRVSIVVTELATNLVRHALQGEILLRISNRNASLEVLSIDRGPGIGDLRQSMVDGFSTAGTPGNGLGAISRMSSAMDCFSTVPGGTVIYSRIDNDEKAFAPEVPVSGIVHLPAPYETVCGDVWRMAIQNDRTAVMLVDGLGHGPQAFEAAEEAGLVFDADPFAELSEMVGRCHARMRSTRGGALAVAHVDRASRSVKYVGVGNIAGTLQPLAGGKRQGLVSHNGTVGLQCPRSQEFSYFYEGEPLLILHSDGLQTRWAMDAYDGLMQRHPALIAGVLYRDFKRGRDDVTVFVARLSHAQAVV